MTPHDHKAALQRQLVRDGGYLPPAPDGPVLACFSALELAQAMECEIQRAQGQGLRKIQLNMSLQDAADMAAFLRRAAFTGA